jgi:hypothetical protein
MRKCVACSIVVASNLFASVGCGDAPKQEVQTRTALKPPSEAPAAPESVDENNVTIATLKGRMPDNANWRRLDFKNPLHAAEFSLPSSDSDRFADGRVLIYTVRSQDVLPLLKGWILELTQPDEKLRGFLNRVDEIGASNARIELMGFDGELGSNPDDANWAAWKTKTWVTQSWTNRVAVLRDGDNAVIVRAVGPQETLESNADALRTFVDSLH